MSRPVFLLADDGRDEVRHALEPDHGRDRALCGQAEPEGRWLLSGYTPRPEDIGCDGCRARAMAIVTERSAAEPESSGS